MKSRTALFVLGLAVLYGVPQTSIAQTGSACAVTVAPNPPFVPPTGWDSLKTGNDNVFLFGSPRLWAYVHSHWKLDYQQRKLPFFSQQYDWQSERPPQMVVMARRLDAPAPVVWAQSVNGAGPSHRADEPVDMSKPGFMVTALDIPAAGCWEISARYSPPGREPRTLSYTVLIEP